MGPNKNPELFDVVAPPVLEASLADEIDRRVLLAGVLSDLSTAFEAGDGSDHEVTDPTLAYKLVALACVQNTGMGVAGSNPIEALQVNRSTLTVRAQAAPPHDSYHSDVANATVSTRAIRMRLGNTNPTTPTPGTETQPEKPTVEFFGLNMYVPDMLGADPTSVLDPETTQPAPIVSSLVIVDPTGRTRSGESYISGETSIIAVRNIQTGDAKVYSVTPIERGVLEGLISFDGMRALQVGQPFMHDGAAYVVLPNGQLQCVRVLTGEQRRAAADEFAVAASRVKSGTPVLSEEELRAVRNLNG